jgi:hypothetical protein
MISPVPVSGKTLPSSKAIKSDTCGKPTESRARKVGIVEPREI